MQRRWAVIGFNTPVLGVVYGKLFSDAMEKANKRFGAHNVQRLFNLKTERPDDD